MTPSDAREADTVVISLHLLAGADPIEGLLRGPDGIDHPFRGWLHLTGLLRAAADEPARGSQSISS